MKAAVKKSISINKQWLLIYANRHGVRLLNESNDNEKVSS